MQFLVNWVRDEKLINFLILKFILLVPQIIMAYMNIAVSILIAAFIKTPRTLPKPIKITPTQEEFRETYISSKDSG